MTFSHVDATIRSWSSRRRIPLYTQYKDEEVRSFHLVGVSGKKAQIWVEVNGDIAVHAWDHKKQRWSALATTENLSDKLDEALVHAQDWTR